MMRSVSMSLPRSGTAVPCMRVMLVVLAGKSPRFPSPLPPHLHPTPVAHDVSDVHHLARYGGGRYHRRAHEQRASRRTSLTAFEIAVRRRGTDLATLESVRIHGQAHRASGPSPFESGVREHPVQSLSLRGAAHSF